MLAQQFSYLTYMSNKSSMKNKEIVEKYESLCALLPQHILKSERALLDQAFEMAYCAHDNTFRKSNEPYIIHPIAVARIVVEDLRLGPVSLVASLLHDVLEDTSVTYQEIHQAFGSEIATIVEGLTKMNKEIPWYQPKQAEIFQDFLRNITKDRRIILIKLADRLDNMRSLESLPKTKQWRIASETKRLYIPIAHRLGLSKIKTQLEDLYLKTVEPNTYYSIANKIAKKLRERETQMLEFIKPIAKAMKKHGLIFRISTRAKSIYSIYKKLKHKKVPFDQIYDLLAVRIIIDTNQEKVACWQAYGIVTSLYIPNNKRKKDWISTPKSNGYESLHITVLNKNKEWVEVQIRTKRMHEIASRGIAAHWKYKEKKWNETVKGFDSWLEQISYLARVDDDSVGTLDRLERGLSTKEEVQVFAEKGHHVRLPKGATVLDFAIDQLGAKGLYARYAFVNQDSVSIDYVLKNHDQIKLELDPHKIPGDDVLSMVVTPKASGIVQDFFKEKHQADRQKGVDVLTELLAGYDIAYTDEVLEHLRDFLGEKTTNSLLFNIANGAMNINDIIMKFSQQIKNYKLTNSTKPIVDRRKLFLLKSTNTHEYELAKCCQPIPGQQVFGVILGDGKIRIHTVFCNEGNDFLARYGGRIVEAEWYNTDQFEVTFTISFLNNTNVMPALLSAIRPFDIQSLLFRDRNSQVVTGNISAFFKNIKEMDMFLQRIESIPGIKEVSRNKQQYALP